jgi:hypothetical protein
MSVLSVLLWVWIAFNAAILAILVIHRATHLKHRLYWRFVGAVQPFRSVHDLVVAHQHHR